MRCNATGVMLSAKQSLSRSKAVRTCTGSFSRPIARPFPTCASHRGPERNQPDDDTQCDDTRNTPKDVSTSESWKPASFLDYTGKASVLLTTSLAVGAGGFLGLLPDLDGPISALEAILVLCAIVSFHELGHFSAARLQGIHVSKFSVGFGPTLLKYENAGVEYSLRAIPLGGFVAFPDNDLDSPFPPDDPNLLKNRPILDRFFVISAGAVPPSHMPMHLDGCTWTN